MDNLSLNVGKHAQWNLNPPKTAQFDMVVWVQVYNMCIYNPRPVIAYRMGIFYNYEMVFRTAII